MVLSDDVEVRLNLLIWREPGLLPLDRHSGPGLLALPSRPARPVDGDKPAYDATVLTLTGPVYTIEATRVLRTWTVAFKPLADLQALKRAMAWAECERRLETATATIAIAGTAYPFGADAESRENIMGAVTAINAGVGIPNPRSWTPKGALQPLDLTHADLIAIGAARRCSTPRTRTYRSWP
jgi:hypothetical protein